MRSRDVVFERGAFFVSLLIVAAIAWIGVRLFLDSAATRHRYGIGFITGSVWDVPHEVYGASTFIFGSLLSSALALLIAAPLSVGAALFLTDVAPRRLAAPISFMIELLAAIPSIIYGLWGFLVLCPFLQAHLTPWLAARFGDDPLFGGPPMLTNMLAAGVILAIMITPIIAAVSREVIRTVSGGQREAALALGATRWETIRDVVLPEARSGIAGAVILGLGRAVGETMAVVMVAGNTPQIKASLLQSGYTMPALLANQFNEAFNEPLQRSALLEVALVLFVVAVVVNATARLVLMLTARQLRPAANLAGSRLADAVRAGFDFLGRYALQASLVAFVGFQVACDVRARGLSGFAGGFELALYGVALAYFVLRRMGSGFGAARRRAALNSAMLVVVALGAFVACAALGAVLYYVALQGFRGLNVALFTRLPRPPGMAGGGIKNSILGTLELLLIAGAIGIPVGLVAGVYVAELGRGAIASLVRFASDVLNGVPSVVIGLFAYAAFVLPFGHFSAWAGGAALAIMMVPIVARTSEEILRQMPIGLREASIALGATRTQTILSVIVPAARGGILTGVMLSVARVAGETAPLLFTAFGSDQMNTDPRQPISSITMSIYQYAVSPYDDWVRQAWAGALVLLLMILVFNLAARFAVRRSMPLV